MKSLKILPGLIALLFSAVSSASIIRINFEGMIITTGSYLDPTGLFTQGEAINGFWEFESATPDYASSSSRGAYLQSGTAVFRININTHWFQNDTYTLQILNDYYLGATGSKIDAYDVLGGWSNSYSDISGFTQLTSQFTIRDTQIPDALSSDVLFEAAPDLNAFDQYGQSQGSISGLYNGVQFFMNLRLNSLSSSAQIPEPATLALMGLALAGFGWQRRLNKS